MRDFYTSVFGFDTPLLYQEGQVDFVSAYTGGRSWNRKAIILANLHGGGAFELWQHTEHLHVPLESEVGLGNRGIVSVCVRCLNIANVRNRLFNAGHEITRIATDGLGISRCYVKDPENNWIGLVETSDGWLKKRAHSIGGICSIIIGVSDIEQNIHFYSRVCGYDTVLYDKVGIFAEFEAFQGQQKIRRVLLQRSTKRQGALAHLLQSSTIELIQACEKQQKHVYAHSQERFLGDPGFLYICFDVKNMDALGHHCKVNNAAFIHLGATEEFFSLDEASGRCAYIEDPDGALVKFSELYTVPLAKKYRLFLHLRKRKSARPLPKFFMHLLALKRRAHTSYKTF